jgi:RNA polymerase sigma factor (TIGR02999 family)
MVSGWAQPGQVTVLLKRWGSGDEHALDDLIPLVYAQLKELAGHALAGERPGHILQPTALVNEAYLRLAARGETLWENRSHFFAVSARVMRHILVDYARNRRRRKRGAGLEPLPLEPDLVAVMEHPEQVLILDDALTRLSREHPRKSRLVELHSFGGLTLIEAAQVLGVSENTAQRDWKFAKAWLTREFGRQHGNQTRS